MLREWRMTSSTQQTTTLFITFAWTVVSPLASVMGHTSPLGLKAKRRARHCYAVLPSPQLKSYGKEFSLLGSASKVQCSSAIRAARGLPRSTAQQGDGPSLPSPPSRQHGSPKSLSWDWEIRALHFYTPASMSSNASDIHKKTKTEKHTHTNQTKWCLGSLFLTFWQ